MTAKIIAFPSTARGLDQPATTPVDEDEFYEWYEDNVVPLASDLASLEALAMETDRTLFWSYARSMAELLSTWPIPAE